MDQHVLITGASRGLGAAIAKAFHQRGARVSLFARSQSELDTLAARLGSCAAVYAGDITQRPHLEAALSTFEQIHGPVDVLVNNAGVGAYKPFLDSTPEELTQQIEVNVTGLVHTTHVVAAGMVRRGRGIIFNLASDLARKPLANMAVYAATKHAVAGFSASLTRELKSHGVKVMLINPGIINTHFAGNTPRSQAESWQIDPLELGNLLASLTLLPPNLLVDEFTVHPMGQDF